MASAVKGRQRTAPAMGGLKESTVKSFYAKVNYRCRALQLGVHTGHLKN